MTCTVIVAFFVQPTNTLGGQANEVIDLASEERYKQKLRSELGLPDAHVRLFREGSWGMPPIATGEDLNNPDIFTEFVGHAAAALDRLNVADEIVTAFARDFFEKLTLPTSGRVIQFQAITAPRHKLGELLDAETEPFFSWPGTEPFFSWQRDKRFITIFLGACVYWLGGTAVFLAISDRWDDDLVGTIVGIVIGIVAFVSAIALDKMESSKPRIKLISILIASLIAAAFLFAFLSAEAPVSTT
jgi:hypothetical protein